jgi:ArsR family transcriptional regulator
MTESVNPVSNVFNALGHPSRLIIVNALAEKEFCVCELKELVGSEMSTVSKHLSVLKNSGIVDCRKQNNQIFYRLKLPCVTNFIKCLTENLCQE